MNPSLQSRSRAKQRGSILIICMVLAGIGTIGAAAFFSLIHAKSQESLERETAITRRTRVENGRVLAKELMLYRTAATTDASTIGNTATISDNRGDIVIEGYEAAGSSPLGYSSSLRTNKSGAVSPNAFSLDVTSSISDGETKIPYQFQAKSFPPALAGDLLVVEPQKQLGLPSIQITGDLRVKGRAVFWDSNYASSGGSLPTAGVSYSTASVKADRMIQANPIRPKLTFLNTSDEAILPDNLPLPPTTAGRIGAGAYFDGRSELVANPSLAFNDYLLHIVAGAGLELPGSDSFVSTNAPATNDPGPNDATLLAMINALPPGLPNSLPTDLAPHVPLSSQVLSALIPRSVSASDSLVLSTILNMNIPLPADVMTQVVGGVPSSSNGTLWGVVESNPVAVALDGDGTAYIDLDNPITPNVMITNQVDSVALVGQEDSAEQAAAALMAPLLVVLHDDGTGTSVLKSIHFVGPNYRPVVLAIKKQDNTVVELKVSGSAFPECHFIMDFDNVETLFAPSPAGGSATFVGGLRTNRSVAIETGSVIYLEKETRPDAILGLRSLAARNAWVESYRTP